MYTVIKELAIGRLKNSLKVHSNELMGIVLRRRQIFSYINRRYLSVSVITLVIKLKERTGAAKGTGEREFGGTKLANLLHVNLRESATATSLKPTRTKRDYRESIQDRGRKGGP